MVAETCEVDISRPYYWTYPKSKGGTDGLVPSKYHSALLAKSRERNLGLTPDDLISKTRPDLPNLNNSNQIVNRNKSTTRGKRK